MPKVGREGQRHTGTRVQGLKAVINTQLHIVATRNTGLELPDLLTFQEKLKS